MKAHFIRILLLFSFYSLCIFCNTEKLLAKKPAIEKVLSEKPFIDKPLWRELSPEQAQKQTLPLPSFAPLVEKALPALVVITTEALVEQPALEFPGLPGPFRFFMPLPPEKQQGQGSGFIINPKGLIVTNQHVVDGAQKIKVKVGSNPREFSAKILGADKELDIALLEIITDAKEQITWPFLPLGNSDKEKLGDWVLALGSPLGLSQSVSFGIVSHKHRGGITPSGRDLFIELMQFSLALNPGNSGGPVLNASGEVIAVSESIHAAGQSIAFGVPIDLVKNLIPQLFEKGHIQKSYLGVESPETLSPQYAKVLGLSVNDTGVMVSGIAKNSPAEKAGIKPMDVILEIDGKKVADAFNLRQTTAYAGVGKVVDITIFRKGKGTLKLKVKLELRPDQANLTASAPKHEAHNLIDIPSIGLSVVNTPLDVKAQLKLSDTNKGAQVVNVRRGSKANLVGIMPNDVIIEMNDIAIKDANQLKTIVDKAEAGQPLPVKLRRGDYLIFAPLEKPE